MIITHNAYQYIYRYQDLPYFVQWVDDTVYAYFSGEPYQNQFTLNLIMSDIV